MVPRITPSRILSLDAWLQGLQAAAVFALCILKLDDWFAGFDDWWHSFFAHVRPLSYAWSEVMRDSHPPLAYAPIRVLGDCSIETQRLLGAVWVALAVPFLHRAAQRARLDPWVRHLIIASTVLSPAWIAMGVTLRAYGAGLFFMAVALSAVLGAMFEKDVRSARRDVWLMALAGGFLLPWSVAIGGAVAATTLTLAAVVRAYSMKSLRSAWDWLLAAKGPIILIGASVVGMAAWTILAKRPHPRLWLNDHFPPLQGPEWEWWLAALGREWKILFGYDSATSSPWLGPLVLAFFLVVGTVELCRNRAPRAMLVLLLVALFLTFAALADLDRYPFGGKTRHQILLYPVAALALAATIDAIVRPDWLKRSIAIVCAVAMFWVRAPDFVDRPGPDEFQSELLWEDDYRRLAAHAAPEDTVLCDSFSCVAVWAWSRSQGDDWTFERIHRDQEAEYHVFRAQNGSRSRQVIRLTTSWRLRLGQLDSIARTIAATLGESPGGRAWIYVKMPTIRPDAQPPGSPIDEALATELGKCGLRLIETVPDELSILWGVSR